MVEAGLCTGPRPSSVAEAAKVIENVQRDLNIALVNELAMLFDRMGIDSRAVLDAAGSKWNFHPYQTGARRRALHRRRSVLSDDQGRVDRLPPPGHPRRPTHQRRDGELRRRQRRDQDS